MKRLLLLQLLLVVSCSEEPSLLDRCIEANIEEVNFENKFMNYYAQVSEWRELNSDALDTCVDADNTLCKLAIDEFNKSQSIFIESLTDTETSLYKKFSETNPNEANIDEAMSNMQSLQAKAIDDANNKAIEFCNLQGIY